MKFALKKTLVVLLSSLIKKNKKLLSLESHLSLPSLYDILRSSC